MKLNTQIRYGVRALCDIVYNSQGSPVQVRELSERQNISPRFIEQIFQKLKRGGILRSVRGPAGGYFLTRKPEDISIGDIIRAIDGKNIDLVSCENQKKDKTIGCEKLGQCVLSEIWGDASMKLMEYFNSITIKQVCHKARERGTGI